MRSILRTTTVYYQHFFFGVNFMCWDPSGEFYSRTFIVFTVFSITGTMKIKRKKNTFTWNSYLIRFSAQFISTTASKCAVNVDACILFETKKKKNNCFNRYAYWNLKWFPWTIKQFPKKFRKNNRTRCKHSIDKKDLFLVYKTRLRIDAIEVNAIYSPKPTSIESAIFALWCYSRFTSNSCQTKSKHTHFYSNLPSILHKLID